MAGPVDKPSRSDRFVAGLSQLIGGPIGDHATGRQSAGRFLSPGRVVLALACLTLALHWVQKSPCRESETWIFYRQLSTFCYTDVVALYGAEGGLSVGGVPYLDYPLEYPVLTGIFMALIGLPVNALGDRVTINEFTWFYDLTALALAGFAIVTVLLMLRLRTRRPWDVAMFAAAPILLLTATVNWDLLAVVLAIGGLYAWARRQPVLAGVLLGLGATAKLWPAFLFVALLALGIRTGRLRPVWRAIGAGAVTAVGLNLLVMAAVQLSDGNLDNWLRFFRLNRDRTIDWGTFWYVGQYLDRNLMGGDGPFAWLGAHINPHLNWLTYGLFGLACLGVAALALLAPRRPRLAALAFLLVAAFLLTSKVWSQQFVLWLLPLVVLARPRWGAFLAWQAAELLYFFTFYGQLLRAVPSDQLPEGQFVMPEGWFILAATLRWITVVVLCGYVIRDALRPGEDAVRRSYPDDPDGGEFDGAPDPAANLSRLGLRRSEVEDDDAVDHLPGDPEPVAGGLQRSLPLGADRGREDQHRLDAD